jgi:hypothetical protein
MDNIFVRIRQPVLAPAVGDLSDGSVMAWERREAAGAPVGFCV